MIRGANWEKTIRSRQVNTNHKVVESVRGQHTNCRLKCSTKITLPRARELCRELNSKPRKTDQDTLLMSSIQVSPGSKNAQYLLRSERGEYLRVCQAFWSSVFNIGNTRRQSIVTKMKQGQTTFQENRGIHNNRPRALTNNAIDALVRFLHSFPAESSHYLRNKYPNRKYLSADLCVQKMHSLYLASADGRRFGLGYTKFLEIFRGEHLHIGFPRSDTCTVCDQERLHPRDRCSVDRCAACTSFVEHSQRVKAATDFRRLEEQRSKESHEHIVLSIDLMKTVQLPRLTNEHMFYLRKLSCYVFTLILLENSRWCHLCQVKWNVDKINIVKI